MTYVGKFGVPDIAKLPKLFKGCTWTEPNWTFDAPSVIYFPTPLYGLNGVEHLLEDYLIDLANGEKKYTRPTLELGALAKEFYWQGWSIRNMKNRKRAWHYTFETWWYIDGAREVMFDYKQVYYGEGPQK